jgi:hypothetical protein
LLKIVNHELGFWQKQVKVTGENPVEIDVDFTKFVTITVAVNSGWADIYVDGQPTGRQTPSVIELRSGTHTIEVRRAGYAVVEGAGEITVTENRAEPLVFELMSLTAR